MYVYRSKYFGVSLLLIIMGRRLLMSKSRVLLEDFTSHEQQLALKLCSQKQILKFPNKFRWTQEFQRWQSVGLILFQYFPQCPVELELYLVRDTIPLVIGEGVIHPSIFTNHLNEEVKVLLRYDGIVTGWLYCQFCTEEDQESRYSQENQKFLSLQKINLHFMQEIEEEIHIKIKQNTIIIFEKAFTLNQRKKTLFPNIKRSVRLSDVIKIELTHCDRVIKPIMFLVDNIKRGTTATLQWWLRNHFKNKMGNLILQYYMENLFLSNERFMRSRKAIVPDSIEYQKTNVATKIVEKNKQNEVIKKVEDVDRRIQKINTEVKQMVNNLKSEEKKVIRVRHSQKMLDNIKNGLALLSVRKRTPNSNKIKSHNDSTMSTKQKLSFYFQNEKK